MIMRDMMAEPTGGTTVIASFTSTTQSTTTTKDVAQGRRDLEGNILEVGDLGRIAHWGSGCHPDDMGKIVRIIDFAPFGQGASSAYTIRIDKSNLRSSSDWISPISLVKLKEVKTTNIRFKLPK